TTLTLTGMLAVIFIQQVSRGSCDFIPCSEQAKIPSFCPLFPIKPFDKNILVYERRVVDASE
ncbi:hypothetical protein, partial [Pectobacterium versatile]|uniref:hypothetical protein n=1 Tax=Pectobacterium versatile TaxID=2488639 RepID=UPI001F2A5CD6